MNGMAINKLFEKDETIDFYGLCTMIFAYRTYIRPLIDLSNGTSTLYAMNKSDFNETVAKFPPVFTNLINNSIIPS